METELEAKVRILDLPAALQGDPEALVRLAIACIERIPADKQGDVAKASLLRMWPNEARELYRRIFGTNNI